jgi:hypothetical protein
MHKEPRDELLPRNKKIRRRAHKWNKKEQGDIKRNEPEREKKREKDK